MKIYYYNKVSKDVKCGCRMGYNIWHKTSAKNKKEVVQRIKRYDNIVTVLSESQMEELLNRNNKIIIR